MKTKIGNPKKMQGNVLRLLDANLNRCREGLRVLEDTARFLWDDKNRFFHKFREERHLLDRVTRKLYPKLLDARSSRDDRGRKIPEGRREDVRSVIFANFRRCEESLRVLEEFGKVFSDDVAGEFKQCRFRMYDLEKTVYQMWARERK